MILYPNFHCNKITDITVDFLKENNIEALILDIDNTLLDFDLKMVEGLEEWFNDVRDSGIRGYIVSNSNKEGKIKMVAEKLNLPYISFAIKPFKRGLIKAKEALQIEDNSKIAVIGDQIFTDVLGANRCKMFSILVEPLAEKDIFITKVKRPLENFVKQRYLKSISKEK